MKKQKKLRTRVLAIVIVMVLLAANHAVSVYADAPQGDTVSAEENAPQELHESATEPAGLEADVSSTQADAASVVSSGESGEEHNDAVTNPEGDQAETAASDGKMESDSGNDAACTGSETMESDAAPEESGIGDANLSADGMRELAESESSEELTEADTASAVPQFNDIRNLLMQDDSISFHPDTQTILVVSAEAEQSEHMKSLNIYQAEEHIKAHELPFAVRINGEPVKEGDCYYLVSESDSTVEAKTVSKSFQMTANSGKDAVFILNKGDTYSVSYDAADNYYTSEEHSKENSWNDSAGNRYNGEAFTCFPSNGKVLTEYTGIADDDIAAATFSFVWDMTNYLDVELWMGDAAKKQMDQADEGFPSGTKGYVDFKIELRDSEGNIFLLPKTYFDNYGDQNNISYMNEDGIVSIPLSPDESEGATYGEFDISIPFGLDYRITLLSYSTDSLGGYANVYNMRHACDQDGFYVTDKTLLGGSDGEWGSFMEFTFMPLNKEIRIEKQTEGEAPDDLQYQFRMTQLVPAFNTRETPSDPDGSMYKKDTDIRQPFSNYPYTLYDAKTGEKVQDFKTDDDGSFSLKSGQYAIFKVWELPEDYADYRRNFGTNFKEIYDFFDSDVKRESEYIVDEVESPDYDCATTVVHKHKGKETQVNEKRVSGVYGGDEILYRNLFGTKGRLSISKAVDGEGLPDAGTMFEFTITKDGAAAAGKYSVDDGDVLPIPSDGKIRLKAGQRAQLSGLSAGEYLVTETAPTQQNYQSTSFSVSGGEVQNGLSAPVEVTETSVPELGGWKTKDGELVKDENGYYIYTLTKDQIKADGTIDVDCDALAESIIDSMSDYLNFSPCNFKVKFVNETGTAIQYKDYQFNTVNWIPTGQIYTPSGSPTMRNTGENADEYSAGYGWGEAWQKMYAMLTGRTVTAGSMNVTGFDGNPVRIAISPLRCINPAIISYFMSNPGKGTLTGNRSIDSAADITLRQMNDFPELIKQEFTFKNSQGEEIHLAKDDSRTYADFLCAFYGVDSLDALTIPQKYNVLGTGSKGSPSMPYDGQSQITTYYSNYAGRMSNWCIPYTVLNDGTLNYFKTWGFSDTRVAEGKKLSSGGQEFSPADAETYAYQPDYYLLESDPEVIRMAYEYLYARCIRFSLDTDNRPVSAAFDDKANPEAVVSGIKDYLDKTEGATANVLAAMNGGAAVPDGNSIALDRVQGYIEVPNAWNQFRYFDFGFHLIFKTEAAPVKVSSVKFTNLYGESESPKTPIPEDKPQPGGMEPVPEVPAGTPVAQVTPSTPEQPAQSNPIVPQTVKPVTEDNPQFPETGDDSDLAVYLAVLMMSALALGIDAMVMLKRHKRRNN